MSILSEQFAESASPDVDPAYDPYRRYDRGTYPSMGGWVAPVANYSTAQTGYGSLTTATGDGVSDAGAGDSAAISDEISGGDGGGSV